MKNQALLSSKDESKKLKCCLLQFLFGTLRVKTKGLGPVKYKDSNWTLGILYSYTSQEQVINIRTFCPW